MNLETLPIIVNLEKFIQTLPVERRAQAYEFAQSFYDIGVGDGIMAGLLDSTGHRMGSRPETKPKDDKGEAYHRYFASRIKQAQAEAKK